jgi:hypothetical protein|tara:strand:- start:1663 stop:1998 length:336 start_codon:yes stop_codon:yes gene_type:complete
VNNKKLFVSLSIFTVLMIITSVLKNETRLIEKNIKYYETNIADLKNNLYESQLDFFYLSSPRNIIKKISNHSEIDYETMLYSRIYLSLDQFLIEKEKTAQSLSHEEKTQKK